MKRITAPFALFLLAAFLAVPACHPVPPVVTPTVDADAGTVAIPVSCVTGVTQQAIADAQQRAITIIAAGVTSGFTVAAIVGSLEALALDIAPNALACALQYLGIKLDYDAQHATGLQAQQKAAESAVARAYLKKHGVVFSSPAPN